MNARAQLASRRHAAIIAADLNSDVSCLVFPNVSETLTVRGSAMSKPAWMDDLFGSIDGMDADRFVSFLTGDAIFRYGSNPPVEGKAAVREAVAGVFSMFRALTHTVEGVWAHPDAVFVQGTVQYTMHDGSAVSLPFLDCFKVDGEKIREFLVYIDPTALAAAR